MHTDCRNNADTMQTYCIPTANLAHCPKVLENWVLCDVGWVLICRIRGPKSFAQGSKASAVIFTTMQSMSHPVRHLSPPPDIALESICQTPLGLPASRPVESPGCNQHRSVPLTPRRSCKKIIKFLWGQQKSMPVAYMYDSLHNVCSMSAQVCLKYAKSLQYYPSCAYLAYDTKKCARLRLLCLSASLLHQVCISL